MDLHIDPGVADAMKLEHMDGRLVRPIAVMFDFICAAESVRRNPLGMCSHPGFVQGDFGQFPAHFFRGGDHPELIPPLFLHGKRRGMCENHRIQAMESHSLCEYVNRMGPPRLLDS